MTYYSAHYNFIIMSRRINYRDCKFNRASDSVSRCRKFKSPLGLACCITSLARALAAPRGL